MTDSVTAPTSSAQLIPAPNAAGWNNSNVKVRLTATDDPGGAGLRSLTYRTSGAVNSGPITGGPPLDVQIAKEGVTHFEFSATDNTGNAESPDKKATVRLDKTPPETFYQLAYGGPTTTVTLYSTDLLSGVMSITYQASGAQVIPSTTVPGSQATFVITQNGVTNIIYGAVDNAGNVETPHLLVIQPLAGVSPTSLSFSAPVGTSSATQTVTVTNKGTSGLTFGQIATGTYNFGVTATSCTGTLAPTSKCTIDIVFGPTAAGPYADTLYISDNASGSPQLVALSGVGTQPGIGFNPPSIDFGTQLVGTTGTSQSIQANSNGTAPMTITDVSAGVGSDFVITQDGCLPRPLVLAVGGSCTVDVAFQPRAGGVRTGGLVVTDDAPASPQLMPLTGEGLVAPAASFSTASLAFPDQPVGTQGGSLDVTVTNTGSADLHVGSVVVDGTDKGDFVITSDTCTGVPVALEGSCKVTAAFQPTATGSRSATLLFTDDAAPGQQTITMSGVGTAPPALAISPTSHDFGAVKVGSISGTQTFTATNNGPGVVTIREALVGGANRADFAVTSTTCRAAVLAVGDTCSADLVFVPTAGGARSASLDLIDGLGATHSATLSGTGLAPAVGLSPASLSFGDQPVGTLSLAQPVTLTNTGNYVLAIGDIHAEGDFLESHPTCGSTLAAGAFCTISVVFNPQAAGLRTGQIVVTSDAPGSPHAVALDGTGTFPAVTFDPAGLDFGSVTLGSSTSLSVSVASTGTAPLSISSVFLSGADAIDFTVTADSCSGSGFQPGTACSVTISFAPSATGSRIASLVVMDNTATGSDQLSLTGTGTQSGTGLARHGLS